MFYATVQFDNASKKPFTEPTTKVVCVGRNYVAHAQELSNPVPKSPLLFIKSTNSLVVLGSEIAIPLGQGECQHELEVAILIGKKLKAADEAETISAISGIGIGLDLTLRDLQTKLKSKGQPWEKAKNFDGACPVSDFLDFELFLKKQNNFNAKVVLDNLNFKLLVNNKLRQKGNTENAIFKIPFLISYISQHFTLYPGDIILTGTPEGVADLMAGDKLAVSLNEYSLASAEVIAS